MGNSVLTRSGNDDGRMCRMCMIEWVFRVLDWWRG